MYKREESRDIEKLKMREWLKNKIEDALAKHQAVLLVGELGAGKRDLLAEVMPEAESLDFSDPEVKIREQQDPGRFWMRHQLPLRLEEVELLPEILKNVPDIMATRRIGLTCSFLAPEVETFINSHPHAVTVIEVRSESRQERRGEIPQAFSPELFTICAERNAIAEEDLPYFAPDAVKKAKVRWTALMKRIASEFLSVGWQKKLMRLMPCIAKQAGRMLNFSELAAGAGLSQPAVRKLWDFLRRAGICFELPAYEQVNDPRAIKGSKIYFETTELMAVWASDQDDYARLLENWVIAEIRKKDLVSGADEQLFFYRNKDLAIGHEIDLLIKRGDVMIPVEITTRSTANRQRLRRLLTTWRGEAPLAGVRVVISDDTACRWLNEKTLLLPAGML